MALYTMKSANEVLSPLLNYNGDNNWILNQRATMGYIPSASQTQVYNMIGRDAGFNPFASFGEGIARKARSAENAIGTTLAAPVSAIDSAIENRNVEDRLNRWKENMNAIYKEAGYDDSDAYYNAKNEAERGIYSKYGLDYEDYDRKVDEARNEGDFNKVAALNDELAKIKEMMNDEDKNTLGTWDSWQQKLIDQANANSEEANQAANNWKDYRENSYIGKKINQDRGKFLGSAINTMSTAYDVASMLSGIPNGVFTNALQGGLEGLANELEENGFQDFDWARAGQNAAIGAASGAATGALNKKLGNIAQKNAAKGLGANLIPSTGKLGNFGNKVLNSGITRGAMSGAVGGATGAGLGSIMRGDEFGVGLGNTLAGAAQGAASGAVSGGIMSAANKYGTKLADKVAPKFSNAMKNNAQAYNKWVAAGNQDSPEWKGVMNALTTEKGRKAFNDRLTNTLNSGESRVGNYINGKTQSRLLQSLGNGALSIKDYSDQGLGKRASERNAFRDSIAGMANNEDGIDGILADIDAYRRPGESNYQAALRYVTESGNGPIYTDDAYNALQEVYGDDFKSDVYKTKRGDYKYRNGKTYADQVYGAKTAQMLANEMDAREAGKTTLANSVEDDSYNSKLYPGKDLPNANPYSAGSDKEGYVPGIEENYETAKLAQQRMNGFNRVKEFRNMLDNGEQFSYGELAELQSLAPEIMASGDTELAQWAGIDEADWNAYQNGDRTVANKYGGFGDNANTRFREQMQANAPITEENAFKDWKDIRDWAQDNGYEDMAARMQANNDFWQSSGEFGRSQVEIADAMRYATTEAERHQIAQEINDSLADDFVTQSMKPVSSETKLGNLRRDFKTPTMLNEEVDRFLAKVESGDAQGAKSYLETAKGAAQGWGNGNGGVLNNSYQDKIVADEIANTLDSIYAERFGNQQDSPTTLGGWLKKAGKRIGDDINQKGVGLSLKNVANEPEYSDDIKNMYVNRNDMLETSEGPWQMENPETEVYNRLSGNKQQTTPQPTTAQTAQVDPWDRLAREFGYEDYNSVIRAFQQANPDFPISKMNAGAITTWLDQNAGDYNPNARVSTQQPVEAVEPQEAEVVPSKTSRESKLKYAQGMELLRQYGAVDAPMSRATNAAETFQELADMGFTKPGDVEKIANEITGSNGYMSKLTKNVIKNAGPVDTFHATDTQSLDDFIDESIELNSLYGTTQGNAIKKTLEANLRSLPSHAKGSITFQDTAEDTFKVVQNLEKKAAELEGRGGSKYSRPSTENIEQAAVLKDVANLLKDRIYEGADVKAALTPEVIADLKQKDPTNQKWAKAVDNFAATAKTAQDLRTFQKPFVRASRYIDNQYVNAATVGGRAATNAADFINLIPATTKAGLIRQGMNLAWNSNPAHRARAAMYGTLANGLAEAPTTETAQPIQTQTANQTAPNTSAQTKTETGGRFTGTPTKDFTGQNSYNTLANIIGRETGVEQIPESTEQYLDAAAGYVAPLAATTSTYGTTTPTSTYEALTGTSSSYSSPSTYNNYYGSTGNSQIDLLGRAMQLAMDADDAEAFGTLYQMYNSALQQAQSSNSGNELTVAQKNQLAKLDSAETAIDELEQMFINAGGGQGPIGGGFAGWMGDWGLNSNAKTYNDLKEGLVNQIAQAVGKTDSLNTEGEVQRALKLIPQLTDDAAAARSKLAELRSMLENTKSSYYTAYGA